jgi:uncharacterized membrane protein YqhA
LKDSELDQGAETFFPASPQMMIPPTLISRFRRLLAMSRFTVLLPIVGIFLAAFGLMVYESITLAARLFDLIHGSGLSTTDVKALAVGLIEVVDIFLIAIGMYMISISLYTLFVDNTLPLPPWLVVQDLEAVKANLVSIVIAVLAVLFLREAVAWTGGTDILAFGASLALIIASLSLYLNTKGKSSSKSGIEPGDPEGSSS